MKLAHAVLAVMVAFTLPTGATAQQSFKVFPSVQILPGQADLAGTCSGAGFSINVLLASGSQTSADVRLSDPNGFVIEQFVDDIGLNIPNGYNGVFTNYVILPFDAGLAAHTPLRLQITTFTGPALTGAESFRSTVIFDCTSGSVLDLQPLPPIPTMSGYALAAMAALLAGLGMALSRRRRAEMTLAPRRRPD